HADDGAIRGIDHGQRHDADVGRLEAANYVQESAQAIFEKDVELSHAGPITPARRGEPDFLIAAETHLGHFAESRSGSAYTKAKAASRMQCCISPAPVTRPAAAPWRRSRRRSVPGSGWPRGDVRRGHWRACGPRVRPGRAAGRRPGRGWPAAPRFDGGAKSPK